MNSLPYRQVARGLVTNAGSALLCLHQVTGLGIWACAGGAAEQGESLHEALRRELHEEAGLQGIGEPIEVMTITTEVPDLVPEGLRGVVTHFFLIPVKGEFDPVPGVPANHEGHPTAEGITSWRWWTAAEVFEATRDGLAVFSPRDLGPLLPHLLAGKGERPLTRADTFTGYPAAPSPRASWLQAVDSLGLES
jgi:ADP-ribose pyrophosphatase YjhB (NUDIX family)